MKKNRIRMIIVSIIILTGILISNFSYAITKINEQELKKQFEEYADKIDINNINKEDVLKVYDEISEKYSNEELSGLLDEYKDEIKEQGISEDVIDYGKELIENTDREVVREIIDENLDFDAINKSIEDGKSVEDAIASSIIEIPEEKKAELAVKVLESNKVFRIAAIVSTVIICILIIYKLIIRWIIYKKAGKHGWAAIIPIYKQIVMYQICDLSPYLIFLWLVPVIGWTILIGIHVVKKFKLAQAFGRDVGFGFGLLFFRIIFESILAFNSNIKYENEE